MTVNFESKPSIQLVELPPANPKYDTSSSLDDISLDENAVDWNHLRFDRHICGSDASAAQISTRNRAHGWQKLHQMTSIAQGVADLKPSILADLGGGANKELQYRGADRREPRRVVCTVCSWSKQGLRATNFSQRPG